MCFNIKEDMDNMSDSSNLLVFPLVHSLQVDRKRYGHCSHSKICFGRKNHCVAISLSTYKGACTFILDLVS